MFPRRFEQVDRAFDINALIQCRVLKAGPHAGPRGQMNDLVEFDRRKEFAQRGGIGQIALDKFKGPGERLDVPKVGALELRVVKIVQVVEGPDGMTIAQQPFADVRTDETGAAGDQKIHGRTLAIRTQTVECTQAETC